jgi:hypothetical protein
MNALEMCRVMLLDHCDEEMQLQSLKNAMQLVKTNIPHRHEFGMCSLWMLADLGATAAIRLFARVEICLQTNTDYLVVRDHHRHKSINSKMSVLIVDQLGHA